MATQDKLVKAGMFANTANAVVGDMASALTAAGTTQATALVLVADHNRIGTAALSSGALLRKVGGMQTVFNGGANPVAVYPPVGGTINSGAANAAFSVAATKSAVFISADGVNFVAVLSA